MLAHMYNAYFLECAHSPTHKRRISHPTIRYREENRHCGESIEIDLSISDDHIITDVSFSGDLSIVTTGSAEILCQSIVGTPLSSVWMIDEAALLEMTDIEVTNRRKLALVLPLLSLRNALHTYLHDGIQDDFATLLPL